MQELRDAGAEAIQINEVRVIGSTSFVDTPTGSRLTGRWYRRHTSIRAIGDPATMSSALAIPGGVIEGFTEAGVATVCGGGYEGRGDWP